MAISQLVRAKGDRLLTEGRVTRLDTNVYTVEGDSAKYTVTVSYADEPTGRCDCKAGLEGTFCSHLYAAAKYSLTNPQKAPRHLKVGDPFEGLN